MFHANVFVLDEQQSGPRGGDKFFSTNWFMGMAQRKVGPGTFTARVMLTLEPATITDRRYPLLFQQGETAYGVPIADGQHPHDFLHGAGRALRSGSSASKGLAFVLRRADGRSGARPNCVSASRVRSGKSRRRARPSSGGLNAHRRRRRHRRASTYGIARIEASGFHGREPDEFRWDIDQGSIDSWSTRLTVQPGKNWSGQYSYGRIASPEALFPAENQERMTASVMYNRPLHDGNWASTASVGPHAIAAGQFDLQQLPVSNPPCASAPATTRGRASKMSSARMNCSSAKIRCRPISRKSPSGACRPTPSAMTATSISSRTWPSALGAQITTYGVADAFKPIYGSHPVGVAIFLRLRPFSGSSANAGH